MLSKLVVFLLWITIGFCLFSCNKEREITVFFDSNGGSFIDSMIYRYGQDVSFRLTPTKEGFIFDGWYIDNETFQIPFDLKHITNFNQNITL